MDKLAARILIGGRAVAVLRKLGARPIDELQPTLPNPNRHDLDHGHETHDRTSTTWIKAFVATKVTTGSMRRGSLIPIWLALWTGVILASLDLVPL